MTETSKTAPPDTTGHQRGTPGYRRLTGALWCAGLATFVLVYCVQGLLPALAVQFRVSSSTASLALSATTAGLAVAMVPCAVLARGRDRVRLMTWSLGAAAVLGLLAPLSPSLAVLVVVRALQGVALAGLPALAMSHVTAEVAPRWLGGAMGALVAGNSLGGLAGRLTAGLVADVGGWRVGLAVVGLVSVGAAVAFRLLLPPARCADPSDTEPGDLRAALRVQLSDPGLRRLYAVAFLLVGGFVTIYNYLTFRLIGPPFELPAGVAGLIFVAYLAGSLTSTAAGRLADRVGRRRVLWIGGVVAALGVWVTVPGWLPSVLLGLVLVTVGFFAGHSVASGWVGRRAALLGADGSPALAAALYLFAFYTGSSVAGSLGGLAWDGAGWPGVVGFVTALFAAAVAVALSLRRIPAPGQASSAESVTRSLRRARS